MENKIKWGISDLNQNVTKKGTCNFKIRKHIIECQILQIQINQKSLRSGRVSVLALGRDSWPDGEGRRHNGHI